MVELAIGLHGIGWDVQVATFYAGGAFEKHLHDAGLRTICLDKAGRWDVLGFGWRLARLLRDERPHVVHGYLDVPNILLAGLRGAMPGARVVWGIRASNMDVRCYDTLFRIQSRLGTMLSRFADLIICNSHAGYAYHAERGYFIKRMIVIPNGIDLEQFRPDREARAELRAAWGIAASQRLIGLVGRLDPMKDPVNFLNAAARLASAHADVRFVCVGDGSPAYRDGLIRLAQGLGLSDRLIWSPARVDVWRVYNALDMAVSSSSFGEGFPNTIAEAMATGVPCVVTDVGDSASLVGKLGSVCAPNDSEALAQAISAALSALPVDSALIRQHIAAHYSSDELLRRTNEQLSNLIEPLRAEPSAQVEMER